MDKQGQTIFNMNPRSNDRVYFFEESLKYFAG